MIKLKGFFLFILLFAILNSGCGTVVTTRVLRPAMINAQPYGGTMTVGTFTANRYEWYGVAQDIMQMIIQAIMSCPGNVVNYIEGPSGLTVIGRVSEYTYYENYTNREDTCTRYVDGHDVDYRCIHYTRRGTATVRLDFNVIDSAGQIVSATTFEDSDYAETHATDGTPLPIDGNAMLRDLSIDLTNEFIKVILPWWDEVDLRLYDCGDTPECQQGIELVKAGQWSEGIVAFNSAIEKIRATPDFDPDDLAEAYWDKALAQQYSNDFAGAIESLIIAIQLNPSTRYQQQLQDVQQAQQEAEALRSQGIILGTSDNQSGAQTPEVTQQTPDGTQQTPDQNQQQQNVTQQPDSQNIQDSQPTPAQIVQ